MKKLQAWRAIRTVRGQRRIPIFAVAALVSVCSVFWGLQPAVAQKVLPQDLWRQVYQRIPDFPQENQYVSNETGKVAVGNTLAARLIRYHLYVKSRTPNYRLDWKLTLADYLGANEYLLETQYPGSDSLRQNPMDGDRAAIVRLTRSQREALVDVLVSIFNPKYQETPAAKPTPRASPQPAATPPTRSTTTLPKPGAAGLLK